MSDVYTKNHFRYLDLEFYLHIFARNNMVIMNSLLAELRTYFATHTKDEILKDWEATAEYDDVGITVEELLSGTEPYCYNYQTRSQTRNSPLNNIGTCFNPEETSGFFIISNHYHYAMQYA